MISKLIDADKPSSRFLELGQAALSDAEILAIIIKTVDNEGKSLQLARKVLQVYNNDLRKLARSSVHELLQIEGMTVLKASTLLASFSLNKRKFHSENDILKIGSSLDINQIFRPLLEDLTYEEFWCLFLNRANHVITKKMISKGGVTGTVVDPKIIFKLAIVNVSSGLILCHNHPSGNNNPSDADISLTKKISEAGRLLDIQVLDHIIIAGSKYYSFADEGKM